MKKLNAVKLEVGDKLYVIDVKLREMLEVELTREHLSNFTSRSYTPQLVHQDYCLTSDIVMDIKKPISLFTPHFYDNSVGMSLDYGYEYTRVPASKVVVFIDKELAFNRFNQLIANDANKVKYEKELQSLRERHKKDLEALNEKYRDVEHDTAVIPF